MREFKGERPWVVDTIGGGIDYMRERPETQIIGLEVDEADRLWIFVVVPDAKWTAPKSKEDVTTRRVMDTLIEVIDPATGRLIAATRIDEVVIPYARGRAYSMLEEPSGDLRAQIWRLEVTR